MTPRLLILSFIALAALARLTAADREALLDKEAQAVLAPKRTALLSAEVAGVVRQIPSQMGDSVSAGEILIRFDQSEKEARLREAEAARAAAAAALRQAELAASEKWEMRKAEAIAVAAKARLAQLETLQRQGQASQAELEAARRDAAVAEAECEIARAALEPKLAAARRDAAASEARYEAAQRELQACTLRAPFAGKVARILVNEYERVEIGQPLVEVIEDQALIAKFLLPGEVYAQVPIGHRFRLRVLQLEQWAEAKIVRVAPALEAASTTFEVHAEVANAHGRIRPGMSATFKVRDVCALTANPPAAEKPQASSSQTAP